MEKIRLSYDNTHLFSGGRDGLVCIFDVKDKEPKLRRDGKELSSIGMNDALLLPQTETERYYTDIKHLKEGIESKRLLEAKKKQ